MYVINKEFILKIGKIEVLRRFVKDYRVRNDKVRRGGEKWFFKFLV